MSDGSDQPLRDTPSDPPPRDATSAAGHLDDLISAYLDGALDGPAGAAAHDHLLACPSCRAELEVTASVAAALRRLPPVELPPLVSWRVAGTMRRVRRRAAASVAAVAAAVALVLSAGLSSSPRVSPQVGGLVRDHAASAPSGAVSAGAAAVPVLAGGGP